MPFIKPDRPIYRVRAKVFICVCARALENVHLAYCCVYGYRVFWDFSSLYITTAQNTTRDCARKAVPKNAIRNAFYRFPFEKSVSNADMPVAEKSPGIGKRLTNSTSIRVIEVNGGVLSLSKGEGKRIDAWKATGYIRGRGVSPAYQALNFGGGS